MHWPKVSLIVVVDGDWKKQFEYGPSSVLARVCGKSIIHLDSLKFDNASPTQLAPAQLKVAHLLPVAVGNRCTTLKLFISEACKLKHKSFFDRMCMLAGLLESNAVPISHRHNFVIVPGDLSCMVRELEGCMCQSATNYRWLVVKEELEASTDAAAVAFNTTPRNAKLAMPVSQFVQTLGACNADVDRGQRHASF